MNNCCLTSSEQFIGKLTHELNTPLTILKANMEMLESSISNSCKDSIGDEIITIGKQIARFEHIVSSLLEISNTSLKNAKFNLIHSLNNAVKTVKTSNKISELDVKIDIKSIDENPQIMLHGNSDQMELAYIKLLNNSIDAYIEMGRKKATIDITIYQTTDALKIKFSDYATGMSEQSLANAFKPFTSAKTHKGLGIGIYLVKNIFCEHGFEVSLKSNHKGTTYILTNKKEKDKNV